MTVPQPERTAADVLAEHWVVELSNDVRTWHPEDRAIHRDGFPHLWRSFTERAEVVHQARIRRAVEALAAANLLAAPPQPDDTLVDAVAEAPQFPLTKVAATLQTGWSGGALWQAERVRDVVMPWMRAVLAASPKPADHLCRCGHPADEHMHSDSDWCTHSGCSCADYEDTCLTDGSPCPGAVPALAARLAATPATAPDVDGDEVERLAEVLAGAVVAETPWPRPYPSTARAITRAVLAALAPTRAAEVAAAVQRGRREALEEAAAAVAERWEGNVGAGPMYVLSTRADVLRRLAAGGES